MTAYRTHSSIRYDDRNVARWNGSAYMEMNVDIFYIIDLYILLSLISAYIRRRIEEKLSVYLLFRFAQGRSHRGGVDGVGGCGGG